MTHVTPPPGATEEAPRLFDVGHVEVGESAHPEYHPASLALWSDGGAFDYASCEGLFLGRTGIGPLRVAWDTNILIDWFEYGLQLIDTEGMSEITHPGDYITELRALGDIVGLSFTRDIRFRISSRQLRDGKLRGRRYALRSEQLAQVQASTTCTHNEPRRHHTRRSRLVQMRPSMDRRLIEDAIASGCHIFLSRDQDDVLSAAEYIKTFGITALKPSAFWNLLVDSGDAMCPWGVDGMVCDNHKFVHLLAMARSASEEGPPKRAPDTSIMNSIEA